MRRWLILMTAAAVVLPGCKTVSSSATQILLNTQNTPREILFLDDAAAHSARLERFLITRPQLSEAEKIQFLLESIRTSPYRFMRNGSDYKGEECMHWLRWKMGHRQYARNPIRTAADFVTRVADRSLATGQFYQAVLPDGRRVPLQDIMQSELTALEESFLLRGLANQIQIEAGLKSTQASDALPAFSSTGPQPR